MSGTMLLHYTVGLLLFLLADYFAWTSRETGEWSMKSWAIEKRAFLGKVLISGIVGAYAYSSGALEYIGMEIKTEAAMSPFAALSVSWFVAGNAERVMGMIGKKKVK